MNFELISKANQSKTEASSTDSNVSRQEMIDFYREGAVRTSAAQSLAERSDALVIATTQNVLQTYPKMPQSDTCMQDIKYLIQLIIYALISGHNKTLNEVLLNGSCKISPFCAIAALNYIKNNHKLVDTEARLTNECIDDIINELHNI